MILHIKGIEVRNVLTEIWHRKEAIIWLVALILLAASNPSEHHYTLCPLHNLGWDFCPGCGMGRSISYLFHLQVEKSFLTHPLGIPAVIILLHRITKVLFKPNIH
jgi:hypothetical protein